MGTEWAGEDDVRRAAAALAHRLPPELEPLSRLAYNYAWSWCSGNEVFESIDAARWHGCSHNPVRLLLETSNESLERAADDGALHERIQALASRVFASPGERDDLPAGVSAEHPVAFVCAEYGLHESLPQYAGGLGVLAGDILKTASDRALPMVGLGLLYRYGYFHQRLDLDGWQHEYWIYLDPTRRPLARVTDDGKPTTVRVPLWDGELAMYVWRVDVGSVPLFLLDADHPDNDSVGQWVTARLYEGSRDLRLAQYVALGCGAIRSLEQLGIVPAVFHLNEGHAVMAALELAASLRRAPAGGLAAAARKVVFTTHTSVAAGNESYPSADVAYAARGLPDRVGMAVDDLIDLGRTTPGRSDEPLGLTPLALRMSRSANAVSARHGEVARDTWRDIVPADQPITHITNGVHVATWMSPQMRRLLERHLGPDWMRRSADRVTWEGISQISDEELWAVRCEQRAALVDYVRHHVANDLLRRGESLDVVRAAADAFDHDRMTIGFARRLASYKRLHVLTMDAARLQELISDDPGMQLIVAGKAHPSDSRGKNAMKELFDFRRTHELGGRMAVVENYELASARALMSGCDVWLNTPRPPLEASGTSGMKAALNGVLQVSVLDGWWAEAYRPDIGWALPSDVRGDTTQQDERVAVGLADILEHEVLKEFYDRDETGTPRQWVARIRRSLMALGPFVSSDRMLGEYESRIYPA